MHVIMCICLCPWHGFSPGPLGVVSGVARASSVWAGEGGVYLVVLGFLGPKITICDCSGFISSY